MLMLRRTLKEQRFTVKAKLLKMKTLLMVLKMVPELKPIPKHSLKRFTTPLINNGGKMLELVKAKYAPIKVTYKGDK
ncbi:protein of unknown function [Streptococcus thermophilus]|nr:protein of unknown function [Streptococcus thermophilus]CAD0173512.1 protein of unknown function [Streptococcus thermophilus]